MAESEHDDLADALSRMAAGDIAPSEHEPVTLPPSQAPAPSSPPRAARPAVARPASARPAAAPAASPKPPAATARPRPSAPMLASTPAPRAAAPPSPIVAPANARKPRPAAPTTRAVTVVNGQTQPEIDGGQSTGLSAGPNDGQIIDDDDSVIVPAPDPAVFEYRSKTTANARAKVLRQKNLNYLRTLIPILFTCGVLLIAFASLKFLSGDDSMLSSMPIWVPGILIFGALIFFGFMGMCMVVVAKMSKS